MQTIVTSETGVGTLRIFLAILVALAHINMFEPSLSVGLYGAMFAVRVFFLMSGFYMALVLDTRYKDSILAFYKARAFRLYPVYWVTLILTVVFLVVILGQLHTFAYWAELFKNPRSWWLIPPVVLSNVSFFGIDVMYLSAVNTSQGSLIYYKYASASDLALHFFVLLGPAWAMATQAMFYLIAPFIMKPRRRNMAVFILFSLALFYVPLFLGLPVLPDSRYLFTANLFLFLFGYVSYLLYKSLRPHLEAFPYGFLAIPFSILLTGVYAYYYPSISACKDGMLITWAFLEPVFIVVLGFFIPFMFVATKDIRWDRTIGELAYPIYVIHIFGLEISTKLMNCAQLSWIDTATERIAYHLTIIIALAVLLLVLVMRPIANWVNRYNNRVREAKLPDG